VPGRCTLRKSTLSLDVELLQRNRWVEVEEDPEGRGQQLRLSSAGAAMLEAIVPAWEGAQRQVAELLGKSGVAVAHEAAGKLGFPARQT